MGGRKVSVAKPRVRRVDGGEVTLPTWEAFRSTDPLNERVVEQVLTGVSTRKDERSLDLANGPPLFSQRNDLIPCCRALSSGRRGVRAPIGERLVPHGTAHPLPAAAITHTGASDASRTDHPCSETRLNSSSTCRAASRILVDVHPGPTCQPVRWKSFQIDESRQGEQRFKDSVLAHHT